MWNEKPIYKTYIVHQKLLGAITTMRSVFFCVVALVTFELNTSHALGGSSVTQRINDWFEKQRVVQPFALSPGIAGVVFPPKESHEPPFTFGSGVQMLGKNIPVDKDTLMEIGSLSKTFIALGISSLVTKNVLSFDDPVQKHLGDDFIFGPNEYVSKVVTVKDLMAHRTGLAEGQGDFMGFVFPPKDQLGELRNIDPVHTFREVFDYSNTGWTVAGQVFRAASNASTWCEALHAHVFEPLNLTRTFCHRNEIPGEIAKRHLAAVHKMNPCASPWKDGPNSDPRGGGGNPYAPAPPLATFEFVQTGKPNDFAWGAADAAGSVISSVSDMEIVLGLMLNRGPTVYNNIFARPVLDYIQKGQMAVPERWMEECGVNASNHGVGQGAAAGLGFDLASNVAVNLDPSSHSEQVPYVEKNGDTNMHKARLGLLPATGAGVLLISNLGGSMGGQLTALKWGILSMLAGYDEPVANRAVDNALATTNFLDYQWKPGSTCNACNRAEISGPCSPAHMPAAPFRPRDVAGLYNGAMFGRAGVSLQDSSEAENRLSMTLGPCNNCALSFSPTSFALVNHSCSEVAESIPLSPWARAKYEGKLAALGEGCSLAEYILSPEVAAAGISTKNGTVAFPWGCGAFPLPDGISVFVASKNAAEGSPALLSILGEAAWREG